MVQCAGYVEAGFAWHEENLPKGRTHVKRKASIETTSPWLSLETTSPWLSLVAAVKKDREPSEKGPEGSLALSRCAGTEERSGGIEVMPGLRYA